MNMLIDIGNSRIKFTVNKSPFEVAAILHEEVESLYSELIKTSCKRVFVVCGRSHIAQSVQTALLAFCKRYSIVYERVNVRPDMLAVNYPDTRQFGTDRFLNLVAAREHFCSNFCVVSCGTAITLDFYTDSHIGGMIAPGIGISRKLLSDSTGLGEIKFPQGLLGDDTSSSIGAGIYVGLQNLVYGSIERIEKSEGVCFDVVLTGGDAHVVCDCNRGAVFDTLLFEGMSLYTAACGECR